MTAAVAAPPERPFSPWVPAASPSSSASPFPSPFPSSLPSSTPGAGLPLDERCRLARLAREGDRRAEERLVRSYAGLVFTLARRVARARGAAEIDDLVSAGLAAAVNALRRYDGGGRLAAFLFKSIRGQILREAETLSISVSIPRHLRSALREVDRRAARAMSDGADAGRALDQALAATADAERSRGSRVERDRLRAAHRAASRRIVRAGGPAGRDEGSAPPVPDASFRRVVAAIDARLDVERALGALGPRERDVLARRYGLRDGRDRSLREVGRELSLSQEAIRKIEASALERARRALAGRGD